MYEARAGTVIARIKETKKIGFLYKPVEDASKFKSNRAIVEKVGEGVDDINKGDIILFEQFSGIDLEENLIILNEDDILAKGVDL